MNGDHIVRVGEQSVIDIDLLLELSKQNVVTSSNLIETTNRHTQKISELEVGYNDLINRISHYEQNAKLESEQRRHMCKEVHSRVYALIGTRMRRGKVTLETKKTNSVYTSLFHERIWGALHERFKVAEYQDIRAIDYDDAITFIKNWVPEEGIDALKDEAEDNWSANHPGLSIDEFLGR